MLINIAALPATEHNICLYVAYLAKHLSFSSIQNYLSAVKFLHMSLGFSCLWYDGFLLHATLKGFKRKLGNAVARKQPITIELLCKIIYHCDPSSESGYIAALSVGFFTFLRKANLCPRTISEFSSQFNLTRGAFAFTEYGAIISVYGSKTIQFKERVLQLPIVFNHEYPIVCPVYNTLKHFKLVSAPNGSPAFLHNNGKPIVHKEICDFLS